MIGRTIKLQAAHSNIATVRDGNQTTLFDLGGMNPASPNDRRTTWPLGLMVSSVRLPCWRDSRSQASGGNCSALRRKHTGKRKKTVKVGFLYSARLIDWNSGMCPLSIRTSTKSSSDFDNPQIAL